MAAYIFFRNHGMNFRQNFDSLHDITRYSKGCSSAFQWIGVAIYIYAHTHNGYINDYTNYKYYKYMNINIDKQL